MSEPEEATMPETEQNFPPTDKRWCAYAEVGITAPPDKTHLSMVAYVVEGERGFYSTTYVGDLEYCRRVAASINESRDLSADDVRDIVSSSMAAQNLA
jgi:hypothetical protein